MKKYSPYSVTPFKFAAIKVFAVLKSWHIRGRLISRFPIKIISRFPTQMLCFPTQMIVGTLCVKDHQVLRLEHRLGLMEILKNINDANCCDKLCPIGSRFVLIFIWSWFFTLMKMVNCTPRLYDKRDDCHFSFSSSNIPEYPAYCVFVSQLIRYARGLLEIWRFSKGIYSGFKVIEAGIFVTETSDYFSEIIWLSYRPCSQIWHFCVTYVKGVSLWHIFKPVSSYFCVNRDGWPHVGYEMLTLSGTPDFTPFESSWLHPFIIYITELVSLWTLSMD